MAPNHDPRHTERLVGEVAAAEGVGPASRVELPGNNVKGELVLDILHHALHQSIYRPLFTGAWFRKASVLRSGKPTSPATSTSTRHSQHAPFTAILIHMPLFTDAWFRKASVLRSGKTDESSNVGLTRVEVSHSLCLCDLVFVVCCV